MARCLHICLFAVLLPQCLGTTKVIRLLDFCNQPLKIPSDAQAIALLASSNASVDCRWTLDGFRRMGESLIFNVLEMTSLQPCGFPPLRSHLHIFTPMRSIYVTGCPPKNRSKAENVADARPQTVYEVRDLHSSNIVGFQMKACHPPWRLYVVITRNRVAPCLHGMQTCPDSNICIASNLMCDGHTNCFDGKIEESIDRCGSWCAWGPWSACSGKPCAQRRSRTCGCRSTAPGPQSACNSKDQLQKRDCPQWCRWGSWSRCLGCDGLQWRTRVCDCSGPLCGFLGQQKSPRSCGILKADETRSCFKSDACLQLHRRTIVVCCLLGILSVGILVLMIGLCHVRCRLQCRKQPQCPEETPTGWSNAAFRGPISPPDYNFVMNHKEVFKISDHL